MVDTIEIIHMLFDFLIYSAHFDAILVITLKKAKHLGQFSKVAEYVLKVNTDLCLWLSLFILETMFHIIMAID